MSSGVDHERFDELVVGQALSALEPEDEALLLAHQTGCPRCAETLAETRAVMGQLAYLPESGPPSSALRASLSRALQTDLAQAEASGLDRSTTVHGSRRLSLPRAGRRPAGGGPRRAAGRLTHRSANVPLPLAVAAGVLVVALAAATGVLASRAGGDAQAVALQQVVRQWEQPGAVTVRLQQPGTDATRAAAVVQRGRVSLVVDGLPALDSEHATYVLWAAPPGSNPRPIASFGVDPGAPHAVVVDEPVGAALPAGSRLMVSREPGMPYKATDIVLRGQVGA